MAGRYDRRYDARYGGPYSLTDDLTDGQILAGDAPVRSDDFAFTLIDAAGKDLGELAVVQDRVPSIRFDTARTVFRTLTGVEVLRADLQQIDVEHERLRVELILQNGSRFPLGTFMFGQDNQAPANVGNQLTPELFDMAFLIDQPLDRTYSVPVGGTVQGLVRALLAPFPTLPVLFDTDDVAALAPLMFLAGSSRYVALAACAPLLGCFPPFLDATNVLRFKAPLEPGDTHVDHEYPAGSAAARGRIFDGTVSLQNASYKAPNRYIVVGTDPAGPVVGVYDIPGSAPHSAANRDGRVVATSRTVQGLTDPSLALHLAYMDAITDRTAYGRVMFAATADPRHEGFDTMNVLGVRYLETAWTMELVSGGHHTHEGSTLWVTG